MNHRNLVGLLSWLNLPYCGPRSIGAIQNLAVHRRQDLLSLWMSGTIKDLILVGLPAQARDAYAESKERVYARATDDAAQLIAAGIDLLVSSEPDAPAAMAGPASGAVWPYLFYWGQAGLLEEPSAAVVCSRSASPQEIAFADAIASEAARSGLQIVTSGSGAGYQTVATAAKRHGGRAIYVMDRPFSELLAREVRREPVPAARVWDAELDPEAQCLISPLSPFRPWKSSNLLLRDQLVADLAAAAVVVCASAGGNIERVYRKAAARGRPVLGLHAQGAGFERPSTPLTRLKPRQVVSWLVERGCAASASAETAQARLDSREIAQLLIRLCRHCDDSKSVERQVRTWPPDSILQNPARAWHSEGSADAGWLLADCREDLTLLNMRETPFSVARCVALLLRRCDLERVRRLLPLWGEQELRPRLLLTIPADARRRQADLAALILARGPNGEVMRVYEPPDDALGRYGRRRYFAEILAALDGGSRLRGD